MKCSKFTNIRKKFISALQSCEMGTAGYKSRQSLNVYIAMHIRTVISIQYLNIHVVITKDKETYPICLVFIFYSSCILKWSHRI